MHPASKRSSRKEVTIRFGPLSVMVDVYSGTYKPQSSTTVCVGDEGGGHEPTKLTHEKYCAVCSGGGEHAVGVTKKAFPASKGFKLAPVAASVELEALEASEGFRDEMNLIEIDKDLYGLFCLETANVYWLSPSGDDPTYGGLVGALTDSDRIFVTRWAPRTNVGLYRVVARAGLLGMIELTPFTSLRAAPNEPPAIDSTQERFVRMALDMVPKASTDDLPVLAENPHKKILMAAADAALEDGEAAVKMTDQSRGRFEDSIADASLRAMLEDEDFS